MKKMVFWVVVFSLALFVGKPADAGLVVIDLIPPFDTVADGIIKFGDGFTTIPADLDHFNESVVPASFHLDSAAIDNAFEVSATYEGLQSDSYFTFNGNPQHFYPNTDESALFFDDFFRVGENNITFYIATISGSNLDDFNVTNLKLSYNAAALPPETSANAVPEPASILLFATGLAGAFFRRKS